MNEGLHRFYEMCQLVVVKRGLESFTMCFFHEIDSYNLLQPEALEFIMPFLSPGINMVSREVETYFFSDYAENKNPYNNGNTRYGHDGGFLCSFQDILNP